MTYANRDPALLVSTLTPLVDLAEKVVRLQREEMTPSLRGALRASEEKITQCIEDVFKDEDDAVRPIRLLEVGDRVRIARKSKSAWIPAMARTLGMLGVVEMVDGVVEMVDGVSPYMARVRLDSGDWWWYIVDDLDLVTGRTPTTDPK